MFSSGFKLRYANLIATVVALLVIAVMVVVTVHIAVNSSLMPSLVGYPRGTIQTPIPKSDALEQVRKSLWAMSPPAKPTSPPATLVPPLSQIDPYANNATLPALPEAPPLTSQPPAPVQAVPLPGNSPFIERPANIEQPRITMTNASDENVTIAFYGIVSQTSRIPPYQTVTVQLLPGDYSFSIWGDTIPPRPGIAIFRRYKEYEATWVIDSVPIGTPLDPIMIGDSN